AVRLGLRSVGAAQHGFGRDAAPVAAHAAGALLLDQRDAQAVLRGADGRRVTAWATADDDKVKSALLSHAQSMPRRASHAGVSSLAPSTFPDESTHFRHVIAP